jgi:hypothetical protein
MPLGMPQESQGCPDADRAPGRTSAVRVCSSLQCRICNEWLAFQFRATWCCEVTQLDEVLLHADAVRLEHAEETVTGH